MEVQFIELNHFSDVSTNSYGQCTYVHLKDSEGRVNCIVVMGRSRVVPLTPITVPRLAALLSVKVSSLLVPELEYDNITEIFWTDGQVVLGYIQIDRRFKVSAAN